MWHGEDIVCALQKRKGVHMYRSGCSDPYYAYYFNM
nr:MAG TPA: cysteine protease [Caudoviricetes sp.]